MKKMEISQRYSDKKLHIKRTLGDISWHLKCKRSNFGSLFKLRKDFDNSPRHQKDACVKS